MSAVAPGLVRGSAAPTIARITFARLWKQATVVGLAFAAVAASSAMTYADTYPTERERRALAGSLGGGSGLEVVFGQVDRIGSVGGYTAYKSFVFLTTIGAAWLALAATRLLRGEEDLGRWQLLLAGRTDARSATTATLAGLGAAAALTFTILAAAMLAAGTRPELGLDAPGALTFSASTLLPGAVFGAVAACCAQLGRTRRVATGLAGAAIAAGFALRMVGDAGGSLAWVSWCTPFGWAELVRPWVDDDLRPLALAALTTSTFAATSVHLASRRDLGTGLVAGRSAAPIRPFGLGSTLGIAGRRLAPVLTAWATGTLAIAFVLGVVTETVQGGLADAPAAGGSLADLGATGDLTVQYLGVCFLLLGAIVALVPAAHVSAARDDEVAGRLTLLFAGPVGRARWHAERVLLASLSVVILGPACGSAVWAGGAVRGSGLDLASVLAAGANLVPAALVGVGIGFATWAVAPRAATASVYVLVAWSLVADLVGSLVDGVSWLRTTSVFHHVALLPAATVDWSSIVALTATAIALQVTAVVALARRGPAGP